MIFLASSSELSREIFGNIGHLAKSIFYISATISVGILVYGIWRRWKLWQIGRETNEKIVWRASVKRLFSRVLSQRTVRNGVRRTKAGRFHAMMFFGFVVLFIGTCLIAVEEYGHLILGMDGDPLFHKGTYFVVYEVFLELFGLAYTMGAAWFLVRMLRSAKCNSVGYRKSDYWLLSALLLIGVTGFCLEGLRIIREESASPWISFVGNSFAELFRSCGVDLANVTRIHFATWWIHGFLVFGFIASIPYTRLLHLVAGSWNLCLVRQQAGCLEPVSIDELESTGKVGVENIQDFTRRQLMSLDACVACGRCTDACPAIEAGKPLSPGDLIQNLRDHLNDVGPLLQRSRRANQDDKADSALQTPRKLHGDVIQAETLWSCTTCNACHEVCPLDVSPVNLITDMRRYLIGEGRLSGPPATALQKVQRSGNPWGLPASDRFQWSDGLNVPTVKTNPGFEVLYWIGCSASYDRRIQKVAQAVTKLLEIAGVNYATLGPEERCTGEFARRMGDEFLFQDSAEQNVSALNRYNVKTILTHCPHCLNSLKQDYPQFGGHYEVVHHSQYLAQLADAGKFGFDAAAKSKCTGSVTYHDPCYLARVQGITDEPRQLIQLASGKSSVTEMVRNRCGSSCCGAGGGRMWFDDDPQTRIGRTRVQEALDTQASTVAVSCPLCLTMMSDGVAAKTDSVVVKDISELLLAAISKR